LGSFSGWKKFDELFFLDIVININRVSRVTVEGGGGMANRFAVLCSVVCSFPFPDFTAYISHVETEKCREIEIKTQEFRHVDKQSPGGYSPKFLNSAPWPARSKDRVPGFDRVTGF
jgi:hypothetical protein